jgi:hypothetical protein
MNDVLTVALRYYSGGEALDLGDVGAVERLIKALEWEEQEPEVTQLIVALEAQRTALRERDQARLAAWNAGAPLVEGGGGR